MKSNKAAFRSAGCRHCGGVQKSIGPLFKRCTSCQAAIWDNEKLIGRVGSGDRPVEGSSVLADAQVPNTKRGEWYVYINDLDESDIFHNYVGYTTHHPYRRLYQHARGARVSSRVSRKGQTVGLRYFEGPFLDRDMAESREAELARQLRITGELGVIDGGGKEDVELVRSNKMNAKDGPREESQLVHELITVVAQKRALQQQEDKLRAELERWCADNPDQKKIVDSRTGGTVQVYNVSSYEYDLPRFRVEHPAYIDQLIDSGTLRINRTALNKSAAKAAAEELKRSYQHKSQKLSLRVNTPK